MVGDTLKNHLPVARAKLGLSQRQVARLFGLKSPNRICDLENGRIMPTVRDCIACQVLYKLAFDKLWPRLHLELESEIDLNIRRFIGQLEGMKFSSERKRMRAKATCKTLSTIVNGLPEDISNVI